MSPAVFEPKADYNGQTIKEVLAFFSHSRSLNLKKYAMLSDDELVKYSLHPRLQLVMSPVDLAYFDAEHDDHHLVNINEILSFLPA